MVEKNRIDLEKEMKEARIAEKTSHDNNIVKNRDFFVGGIDTKTTIEKKSPKDVPNVIHNPAKKKSKENVPFY
tara:strand:+ start:106 stop:324 length:219 start_codon:yes stop_codon:yes gene_type:complete